MRHRHAWTRWGFVLAPGQREASSCHRHAPSSARILPPRFVFLRVAGARVHRPCPSDPKGAGCTSATNTQTCSNNHPVPKDSMDGRRRGGRSQEMAGHWMRVSPALPVDGATWDGQVKLGQGSPCPHRRRRNGAFFGPPSRRRRGRLGRLPPPRPPSAGRLGPGRPWPLVFGRIDRVAEKREGIAATRHGNRRLAPSSCRWLQCLVLQPVDCGGHQPLPLWDGARPWVRLRFTGHSQPSKKVVPTAPRPISDSIGGLGRRRALRTALGRCLGLGEGHANPTAQPFLGFWGSIQVARLQQHMGQEPQGCQTPQAALGSPRHLARRSKGRCKRRGFCL